MATSSTALIAAIVEAVEKVVAEAQPPTAPAPASDAQWMPIGKFAAAHGYSQRSVSRWIRLGMPHVGKGRACRVHVAKACAWLNDDGPRKALRRQGHDAHARSLQ